MSFVPALPLTGYAGWTFLKRTQAAQQKVMAAQPQLQRDEAYFRDRIAKVDSAAQLVADPRLLRITLAAFGLEGDVANRAFIGKVLSDGTLREEALANRLANKQYQKLSAAFGFGDFAVPRNKVSGFADRILTAWKARSFETAVGAQNGDLRLALNAERELADLAQRPLSVDAKWFTVLGTPPLRKVFETALGLPSSFATIDIDRQLDVMKDRARRQLGSDDLSVLAGPAGADGLVRRFLVRAEAEVWRSQTGGSPALVLMSQAAALARRR